MVDLIILHEYCTIQLWRNISGDNFHPIHKVVGNVLVDEKNFLWLNQYRWSRQDVPNTQFYCAYRMEHKGGKRSIIYMSREILGLLRDVGHGSGVGDHKNHDKADDTEKNLRNATSSQNGMNGTTRGTRKRFKCIDEVNNKWRAHIRVNRLLIRFSRVFSDVEAALMYNYAANLVFGEFAYLNEIPEDEMPTYERQCELYDMVVDKLTQEGFSVAA